MKVTNGKLTKNNKSKQPLPPHLLASCCWATAPGSGSESCAAAALGPPVAAWPSLLAEFAASRLSNVQSMFASLVWSSSHKAPTQPEAGGWMAGGESSFFTVVIAQQCTVAGHCCNPTDQVQPVESPYKHLIHSTPGGVASRG